MIQLQGPADRRPHCGGPQHVAVILDSWLRHRRLAQCNSHQATRRKHHEQRPEPQRQQLAAATV